MDWHEQAPAGWYTDPTERFEQRYWNGTQWTEHANQAGRIFSDPLRPRQPVLVSEPPVASTPVTSHGTDSPAADPNGDAPNGDGPATDRVTGPVAVPRITPRRVPASPAAPAAATPPAPAPAARVAPAPAPAPAARVAPAPAPAPAARVAPAPAPAPAAPPPTPPAVRAAAVATAATTGARAGAPAGPPAGPVSDTSERQRWYRSPWAFVIGLVAVVLLVGIALFVRSSGDDDGNNAEVAGRTETRTTQPSTAAPGSAANVPIATLNAEVSQEVLRACQLVLTNGTKVESTTRYNPRWAPAGFTKARLDIEVSKCVQRELLLQHRASPSTPPATTAPAVTTEENVYPGSQCFPVGAKGTTASGTLMMCATTNPDGKPYKEPRWRAA